MDKKYCCFTVNIIRVELFRLKGYYNIMNYFDLQKIRG